MSKPIHLRRGWNKGPGTSPPPPSENPARSRLPNGRQGNLCGGGAYGYLAENRRNDAMERAAARNERSAAAQIAELDRRLGKGKGAVRERARLMKAL